MPANSVGSTRRQRTVVHTTACDAAPEESDDGDEAFSLLEDLVVPERARRRKLEVPQDDALDDAGGVVV